MTLRRDGAARALRQARGMILALAAGVAGLAVAGLVLLASGSASSWTGSLPRSLLPWAAGGAVVLLLLAPVLGRRIAAAAPPDADAVVAAWTAGVLVSAGVREAVGVGGLVLGVLAGSPYWAAGFAGASIVTLLLGWPRPDALRERLRWVEHEKGKNSD